MIKEVHLDTERGAEKETDRVAKKETEREEETGKEREIVGSRKLRTSTCSCG